MNRLSAKAFVGMTRSLAGLCMFLSLASASMKAQTPQWMPGTGVLYTDPSTTKVGIGTTAPETRLHVEGLTTLHFDDWGNDTLVFRGQKSTADKWGEYAIRTSYLGLHFRNTQTGGLMLFLGRGGTVGIGTGSPVHTLSVNGTVGAKEVVVTNTGWADYVFKPEHRLRPLDETAAYITEHGRLPGMPSEAEVSEKGISVGEMQVKLLAKVEELMLHMIQADRENRELRARVARLEAERGASSQQEQAVRTANPEIAHITATATKR